MSDPQEADALAAKRRQESVFAEPDAPAVVSLQEVVSQSATGLDTFLSGASGKDSDGDVGATEMQAVNGASATDADGQSVSTEPRSVSDAPVQSLPPLDPLIKSTYLDKYLIEGHLGIGGTSVVYKARHLFTQRMVAIKMLRLDPHFESPTHQRFVQEAQTLSALNHPNIIRVTDFGYDGEQRAYMVMEYVEGRSLDDVFGARGRLEQKDALIVFRQVCSALRHAHANRVIHRDLKPANILLITDEQGNLTIKIIDFGIAKIADKSLTQTGAVFGSPLYMSPEQCEGAKALDARSDIYSLGCVFYEALTGERAVDGDSIPGILYKHVLIPPKTFAEVNEDLQIDTELECLVMQALAKKPEDRIQTMEAFAEQLNGLYRRLYDEDDRSQLNMTILVDTPKPAAAARRKLTSTSLMLVVIMAITLSTLLSIVCLSQFSPVLTITMCLFFAYPLPLALAAARGIEIPVMVSGLNLLVPKLVPVASGGGLLGFFTSLVLAGKQRVSENPTKTNISMGSDLALALSAYAIIQALYSQNFKPTHLAYSLFYFQLVLSLQWGGTLYQVNRDLIKRGSTKAMAPCDALLAGIFCSGIGSILLATFAPVAAAAALKVNLPADLITILSAFSVFAYLVIAGVLNYRVGQAMDLHDPDSGYPVLRWISPGIGFLLVMMGTIFVVKGELLLVVNVLQGLAFWWAYRQSAKLLKVRLKSVPGRPSFSPRFPNSQIVRFEDRESGPNLNA